MQKKILSGLVLGLVLTVTSSVTLQAGEKKVWITIGDKAYQELKQIAPNTILSESRLVNSGSNGFSSQETVRLVQVEQSAIQALSGAIHEKLKRCGGFIEHSSEALGRLALGNTAAGFAPAPAIASLAPSYAIDNQSTVNINNTAQNCFYATTSPATWSESVSIAPKNTSMCQPSSSF